MGKILIIEDELSIAELQKDYLELNGFQVDIENDGESGLNQALKHHYDLIVLDLMLPGMSGFDICKEIRQSKETPVLMVTARTEEIDIIRGLGLGANDYMKKPFSTNEFVARIKAQLDRYRCLKGENKKGKSEIRIRDLVIDQLSRKVYVNENDVYFRVKEFELLFYMASHPGRIFTKDELFEQIWGMDAISDNATVTVHIGKIRDKIAQQSTSYEYIETVWGVGYRFNA
ncbi:response regulator transcription factor [Halalkalibacter sp. APA_J-10(15)]|uniref:response regulator transcription factor n=1 Tax=unclassified Halalkalibacter TaxID=2893063 RepID=UPI001FF5A667|nr:response regulator transcription factor [Halalkalibacter sp. APA_J-10(15)]MCK0471190.1 response regulator transcription factor [Halalkalibacter sp. APA_J-10(15)]